MNEDYYERYGGFEIQRATQEQKAVSQLKMKKIVGLLLPHFSKEKAIAIADFGGTYTSYEALKQAFPNSKIFSLNVSKKELFKCGKKIVCDLTKKIPLPQKKFDLIVFLDTLEHLIEPDAALENANKLLKKNGLIIITTPNLCSFVNRFSLPFGFMPTNYSPSNYRFGAISGDKQSSWHKSVFNFNSLEKCLGQHGLKTIKKIGFDYGDNKKTNLVYSLLPKTWQEGIIIIAKKL